MNAQRKPQYNDQDVQKPICDIDTEGSIIGTILIHNDAFQMIAGELEPEHFYEPVLGRIFKVMGDLIKQGKVAAPITIKPFIPWDDQVPNTYDDDGRQVTVGKMVARAAAILSMPPASLLQRAQTIKNMWKLRTMARQFRWEARQTR